MLFSMYEEYKENNPEYFERVKITMSNIQEYIVDLLYYQAQSEYFYLFSLIEDLLENSLMNTGENFHKVKSASASQNTIMAIDEVLSLVKNNQLLSKEELVFKFYKFFILNICSSINVSYFYVLGDLVYQSKIDFEKLNRNLAFSQIDGEISKNEYDGLQQKVIQIIQKIEILSS
jgi:hypothetical protein